MTLRLSKSFTHIGSFRSRGVTLIELVAFIVVVGVIVAGVIGGLVNTVKVSTTPKQLTEASQLAQERLELIRARKDVLGFAAFVPVAGDPCGAGAGPPACAGATTSVKTVTTTLVVDGISYTVAATIEDSAVAIAAPFNDGNYKTIAVTVTGPNGVQLARLDSLVANY